jgi:phage terminase small subunit
METTRDKKNTGEVKLTPKEERFCYEYVLRPIAGKAAITAQYGKKWAATTASHMLAKAKIQQRINYLKNNPAEITRIRALLVLMEHEKIAFSDAGQLREGWMSLKNFENLTPEQKSIIQEVTTRETKYGKEIKIKLYDKQRSLDSINAMLGFNALPGKTAIAGKDGKDLFADMTDEELDTKIAELENKLKQNDI